MKNKFLRSSLAFFLFLMFLYPVQADEKKSSDPGTYEVVLTYIDDNGSSSSKTIQISVTKDDSENETIDENDGNEELEIRKISDYILESTNFTVKNRSLDSLSNEEIINFSQARAYNPMTDESIPVTVINRHPIDKNRVEYTLIADEVLITTVIGSSVIDESVGKDIQWENNKVEYDQFTTLNKIFFGSSILILIVLPLLIISILFIIYHRYKNKTQDLLYRANNKKKNQQ
ncbi:MAG: hypothetical protein RR565_05380 [Erysipelothrix sp.]